VTKKKRPASGPEQLVFPFELRVGDLIIVGGERVEVASPPKAGPAGKTTHVWVRAEVRPSSAPPRGKRGAGCG